MQRHISNVITFSTTGFNLQSANIMSHEKVAKIC